MHVGAQATQNERRNGGDDDHPDYAEVSGLLVGTYYCGHIPYFSKTYQSEVDQQPI